MKQQREHNYGIIASVAIAATMLFCVSCCMQGCTASTVRTATVAAPDKTGATVTTTKSETEMKLADDTKLLDQIGAFVVGLF